MTAYMEVAPKRVLYAITKANWGGAQRYVYDLAIASKAAGHDVLVVSGTEGALLERLQEAGVRTETISTMQRDIKLMGEVRSFYALFKIIKSFRPDVVHGNSSKAGLLAGLCARLQNVPCILFTAHGWAFNETRPRWQKAIIALLHYITVLLSHKTICVSGAIRQDASWMPFTRKRFVLIHNGVTPSALAPKESARVHIAPDLARSFPSALWIGTVAELHPTKGLDTLIEAFARVARETSSVLVIMGDGSEWAHLQKLVQIYDLPDRIVLAGFVKDAPQYLSALDVFVLPSRSEALGYALLEAGLASLPAIGTRVGGIPEIIEDRETGLLVPANDPAALARSLQTLLTDHALRTRLGTSLNERVTNEFSTKMMAEKTLGLY